MGVYTKPLAIASNRSLPVKLKGIFAGMAAEIVSFADRIVFLYKIH